MADESQINIQNSKVSSRREESLNVPWNRLKLWVEKQRFIPQDLSKSHDIFFFFLSVDSVK